MPAPSSAQQLPELPEAAVSCILQHVPLRQRLTRCALVCHAWAAHVEALPAHVDVQIDRPERRSQLQDWLVKRGGVVVGLAAQGTTEVGKYTALNIPVPKLNQLASLHLSGVTAQLPVHTVSTGRGSSSKSSSGYAAAAAVLPQLQELRLARCRLTSQLLSELLSATALTSLQWQHVQPHTVSGPYGLWAHIEDNAEQLAQALLPRGNLPALLWQRLQLLPRLTELHLLEGGLLTAADIAPVSTLQHLQHFSLELTYNSGGLARAPRGLLAALQPLTQLQHLQLTRCQLHRVQPMVAAPQLQLQPEPLDTMSSYQCFSALTASSHLTALVIVDFYEPVPQAAFQHMFPPGWELPNLKVLHLHGAAWFDGQHCMGEGEVGRIAASCPALSQVTLRNVTPEGFDVGCLLQLPVGVTSVEGLDWARGS